MKSTRLFVCSLIMLTCCALISSCYYKGEDCEGCPCKYEVMPPMGLEAIPGDREVIIQFYSANSDENWYKFWGFAVHMAQGEYLSNPETQYYYENDSIEEFDSYGDGIVCTDDCEGEFSGVNPVFYVEGGITEVETATGSELPGKVNLTIKNGDLIPCLCDDTDDDLIPCSNCNDDTESIEDCTWGEGARICLENDVTYTVFVVTRYSAGTMSTWSSNWVSFTPTAATTVTGE